MRPDVGGLGGPDADWGSELLRRPHSHGFRDAWMTLIDVA